MIITPSYKPAYVYGGPTFSISKHAEVLNQFIDLQIITTTANGENELDVKTGVNTKVDNVNVIYFNRQTKDHSHFSFGLLKYLWNNCREYDVVQIQSWWNLISIFSALICVLKKCKTIVSPRGMLSDYTIQNSKYKIIVNKIFRRVLYKRFYFHLTSQYELSQTNKLNARFNYLIPNFLLSGDNINTPTEEKQGILYLSRIDKKKNIESLIKSMEFISSQVQLNIAGKADQTYLAYLKKIIPYNSIDRVNWLGQIYGEEKNKIIAKSRLLVLPSFDENFANIVLESLLNGTAVVISKNVGLADFIEKYNLGWVLEQNDKLEDIINRALLDEVKLNFINNNAKEIVLREFNDEKLLKQYLEMYNSILNN